MGRLIGSVVVGYLVMAVLLFCVFTAAYFALGAEGAFQPGSFDPSPTWVVLSFVLGFIAAAIAGWVCQKIARRPAGPKALAAMVLVLGLLFAVPVAMKPASNDVRSGSLSNTEAMMKARQPVWVAFLNPFVGLAGVLVGGRSKREG